MKKFNLKLITPLILTLILQGCMPDSLTKFNKDAGKKVSATSTTAAPVVDASGTVIPFSAPTYLYYVNPTDQKIILNVGTALSGGSINVDGSLNSSLKSSFSPVCTLDNSGNIQTRTFPNGIGLGNDVNCTISGTPTVKKSVSTAFCSDPTQPNLQACVGTAYTWDASTNTCSNPDIQFSNQADCLAGFHKWYSVGDPIPYRIKYSYHDAAGTSFTTSTTVSIGSYTPVASLKYSQADKISFAVVPTTAISNIVPQRTIASSTGSYNALSIISTSNGIQGAVNFVDATTNVIGLKKFIKMRLADSTNFTTNGPTSFIVSSSGVVGKIYKKDSLDPNIVYVENISASELYFSALDNKVCNNSIFCNPASPTTTIQIIDETFYISSAAPNMDNDNKYFMTKFTMVGEPINSYLINSTGNIKPLQPLDSTIATNNGVIFTISPKLPDGLVLDPATGIISGKFLNVFPTTVFTITAANPLSSVSTKFSLNANIAPQSLSLTSKQILTVPNSAFFLEGEELFAEIIPPMAESVHGKILKILSGSQIAVQTTNGPFLAGANLDSGNAFYGVKSFIIPDKSCVNTNYITESSCKAALSTWSTGPVYYNLAVTVTGTGFYKVGICSNNASPDQASCETALPPAVWGPRYATAYECDDSSEITPAGCAGAGNNWLPVDKKAVVAGVFTDAINGDILYLQYLTSNAASVSSALTFAQGDTLEDAGIIVKQIDNETMKLTVASAAAFPVGGDVTSSTKAGAYTYKVSGTSVYLSDITKSATGTLFKINQNLYNGESVGLAGETIVPINGVTHDNLLILERGKKMVLHANLAVGSGVYSISPNLPTGMSLETLTGVISGTPATINPKKDFSLTVTNFLGQATYVFSLEVRDYFSLSESSGAPSFIIHKVGDSQINRKCRVNATDILNATPVKALDIRCFVEGEEEDIYENGLKMTADVGSNICEYVQYAPYYFDQYSPAQSTSTTSKHQTVNTVQSGCVTSGIIPTSDFACEGNHTLKGGPNCDAGYVEYWSDVYGMNAATPAVCNVPLSHDKIRVPCGGTPTACISGPIKDILTDAQIKVGNRSIIYPSPTGLNKTWTHTSPQSHIDFTNLRIANGVVNNKCSNTLADASTWTTALAAKPGISSPVSSSSGGSRSDYSVLCLTAARDLKARIRVTVRDWDRAFTIADGIDKQNPASLPAYMNTGLTTDQFGNTYNNISDWDDNYSGLGAANYTGASCGVLDSIVPTCSGAWPVNATDCANVQGTWTGATCKFTNQYQCNLHGGTWNGNNDYAFPESGI